MTFWFVPAIQVAVKAVFFVSFVAFCSPFPVGPGQIIRTSPSVSFNSGCFPSGQGTFYTKETKETKNRKSLPAVAHESTFLDGLWRKDHSAKAVA
jgi:hypothetical protein